MAATHGAQPIPPDERVARVIALYRQIAEDLDALEKEGRILRTDIQAVIDKEKMKDVLEKIIHIP